MIVPPTGPRPYVSAWSSGTGYGAVAYGRSGTSSAMKAVRHSPSKFMAVLPTSKSFALENSSPAPAANRSSLSAPVWKSPSPYTSAMKSCCHWNMAFHCASVSTADVEPSSLYHFAPNRFPRFGVLNS